eukprot:870402-Amphidinium_carterae.2
MTTPSNDKTVSVICSGCSPDFMEQETSHPNDKELGVQDKLARQHSALVTACTCLLYTSPSPRDRG